jgi:hypothetical protein
MECIDHITKIIDGQFMLIHTCSFILCLLLKLIDEPGWRFATMNNDARIHLREDQKGFVSITKRCTNEQAPNYPISFCVIWRILIDRLAWHALIGILTGIGEQIALRLCQFPGLRWLERPCQLFIFDGRENQHN